MPSGLAFRPGQTCSPIFWAGEAQLASQGWRAEVAPGWRRAEVASQACLWAGDAKGLQIRPRRGTPVLLEKLCRMDRERCAIGVDELFFAKGRWWCHLMCDDYSPQGLRELHEFARAIGVSERAFHDPPRGQPRPHYDLTPEFRDQALAMGAHRLTQADLIAYLKRGRERRLSSPS